MLGTGNAQQPPTLSGRAARVKKSAATFALNAPISVVKARGEEEFGTFQSSDDVGFTFYDVDLKNNVTLSYTEVRRIRNGYGGVNSLSGRHTSHTKALIITAVVLGVLGGIIALAASSRN